MLKKEDNRIYSANFKISSINAPDMGVLYSPNFMFSFLNAKFLNTDNSNLLMQQIPTLVVSRYCPILPKRATLVRTSSKNRSWEVDIEEEDDKRFYLKNGWNTFVEDNDLETAEFLVFKFDAGMREQLWKHSVKAPTWTVMRILHSKLFCNKPMPKKVSCAFQPTSSRSI
ncbi:uncharacterized protein LOC129290226 isoform X2 [Prosopis cineraria]|uniref:uncharacterized protein LOC129290226 isoform X2 n=1 Tax=Prosopis cineraria TaxID=364024 RepID=UPI0024108840|nr:uncharacterized protein LOC129290226 isoform X2 [Prosopis cineraria]